MCYKREKHFWTLLGGLKHIRHPLAQPPLCPPKPSVPVLHIPCSQLKKDFGKLLESELFADVVFCVRGVYIPAHRACLITAADVFKEMFLIDLADIATHSTTTSHASTSSASQHLLSPSDLDNANVLQPTKCASWTNEKRGEKTAVKDTAILLDNEETASLWSLNTSDSTSLKGGLPKRELNHPAFKYIELREIEDSNNRGRSALQTLVTVTEDISPAAFKSVLAFIYTGNITYQIFYEILLRLLIIAWLESC